MKMKIQCGVGVLLLLFSSHGQAYNFTPTQSEFNGWDTRCKKAYSAISAGRLSGYFPKMSAAQSAEVSRFGEAAGGAWHYCAGVIYLQRAMLTSGQEREGNLKRAVGEMEFTARNIPESNSWYVEIQIDLARAYFEYNNLEKSFSLLSTLVKTHPNNSLPYTALAYFLKKNNQLTQAISVLQNASELLMNESAELNYFLGWYLMDADKTEAALAHAKRAYALNYPVPTLRQRLASKGLSW